MASLGNMCIQILQYTTRQLELLVTNRQINIGKRFLFSTFEYAKVFLCSQLAMVHMFTVLFYPLACYDIIIVMNHLPVFTDTAVLRLLFLSFSAHPCTVILQEVYAIRCLRVTLVASSTSTDEAVPSVAVYDMR